MASSTPSNSVKSIIKTLQEQNKWSYDEEGSEKMTQRLSPFRVAVKFLQGDRTHEEPIIPLDWTVRSIDQRLFLLFPFVDEPMVVIEDFKVSGPYNEIEYQGGIIHETFLRICSLALYGQMINVARAIAGNETNPLHSMHGSYFFAGSQKK
jgi:hypothetical protein